MATPTKYLHQSSFNSKSRTFKLKYRLHILHRLVVFIFAIVYVIQSFGATYTATLLLRGRDNPYQEYEADGYFLLATLAGGSSIRVSNLIQNSVLNNSTTPLTNGTVYFTTEGASLTRCSTLFGQQAVINSDPFLRTLYAGITEGAAYNVSGLDPAKIELIAPVIDCTAGTFMLGGSTNGRFFFLVRQRNDIDKVTLVVVTLGNQPYFHQDINGKGAASVATVQLITDMASAERSDHFLVSIGYPYQKFNFRVYEYMAKRDGLWVLRPISRSVKELRKSIQVGSHDGFFIKAESEQSNINNAVWALGRSNFETIARWTWITKPILHDSWAWVHGIQFIIGIRLLSNLVILCMITVTMSRTACAGKFWLGDAFVSISTSQMINGIAVLITWFMNEFWVLHEFVIIMGYETLDLTMSKIYENPMRVGLLTVYFSLCGIIGQVFKERIDPLVAGGCFYLGYQLRFQIVAALPSVSNAIKLYAWERFTKGESTPQPGQERISPMKFWTAQTMGERNYKLVFLCLLPIYSTLLLIVVYVIGRKIYRRFNPPSVHVIHTVNGTARSENDASLAGQMRVLTLFEVATGAQLEDRFGMVSDYETCIFLKGTKHASPDGIFSTGFIIANNKYLLQTRDYWSIVLMKILGRRFRNIFVYEMNGTTVEQTARLVYPNTLTFIDLTNLSVSMLS